MNWGKILWGVGLTGAAIGGAWLILNLFKEKVPITAVASTSPTHVTLKSDEFIVPGKEYQITIMGFDPNEMVNAELTYPTLPNPENPVLEPGAADATGQLVKSSVDTVGITVLMMIIGQMVDSSPGVEWDRLSLHITFTGLTSGKRAELGIIRYSDGPAPPSV